MNQRKGEESSDPLPRHSARRRLEDGRRCGGRPLQDEKAGDAAARLFSFPGLIRNGVRRGGGRVVQELTPAFPGLTTEEHPCEKGSGAEDNSSKEASDGNGDVPGRHVPVLRLVVEEDRKDESDP